MISIFTYRYLSERFDREYAASFKLTEYQDYLVELSEVWRIGKTQNDETCKTQQNTDEFFYQCNPKYYSCLIKNDLIKHSKSNIKIESEYEVRQKSTHREYLYKLVVDGVSQELVLKDSCHEVYLPQRYYPFLVENRKHTYDWDNHHKNIFVDKYLVRAYEIIDYAKDTKNSSLLETYSKSNDADIVYNLSKDQMKDFCHYQGKEILSAQVFDAASIFPEDEQDNHSRLLRAPFYPWSRKNTKTEIFEAQENNQKITSEIRSKLCTKIYAKDCKDFPYINYSRESVSWMGMNEVLGGYFEYLPNVIYPLENLKISSMYYPLKSKVHRTGIRGYWDTEDFGVNNLLIKNYEEGLIEDYKIAFRCMRRK